MQRGFGRTMKRLIYVILCILLLVSLLCSCSEKKPSVNIQLTPEQESYIDLIVQNRNDWKEVKELVASYPTNRVHIAESTNGIVILTVAYVDDDTNLGSNWQIYVVNGYAVSGNTFGRIQSYHKDWIVDSIQVDLDKLSDSELREILCQSYRKYLSKN